MQVPSQPPEKFIFLPSHPFDFFNPRRPLRLTFGGTAVNRRKKCSLCPSYKWAPRVSLLLPCSMAMEARCCSRAEGKEARPAAGGGSTRHTARRKQSCRQHLLWRRHTAWGEQSCKQQLLRRPSILGCLEELPPTAFSLYKTIPMHHAHTLLLHRPYPCSPSSSSASTGHRRRH
jgi:hypothetical protein